MLWSRYQPGVAVTYQYFAETYVSLTDLPVIKWLLCGDVVCCRSWPFNSSTRIHMASSLTAICEVLPEWLLHLEITAVS